MLFSVLTDLKPLFATIKRSVDPISLTVIGDSKNLTSRLNKRNTKQLHERYELKEIIQILTELTKILKFLGAHG